MQPVDMKLTYTHVWCTHTHTYTHYYSVCTDISKLYYNTLKVSTEFCDIKNEQRNWYRDGNGM